jgi:hypothetical protein
MSLSVLVDATFGAHILHPLGPNVPVPVPVPIRALVCIVRRVLYAASSSSIAHPSSSSLLHALVC